MQLFFTQEPLLGLFFLSILASTLLPLGSEWLLAGMIIAGQPLAACVLVATTGNIIGACSSYGIGLWGEEWIIQRVLRISTEQQLAAEQRYRRFGTWALLFSWVPLIGDPICLASGVLRMPFSKFLFPVALGKFGRYLSVALLAERFV